MFFDFVVIILFDELYVDKDNVIFIKMLLIINFFFFKFEYFILLNLNIIM